MDAAAPDAAPDRNPGAITLTEVTYELGDGFPGGRQDDELLGVGSGAAVADVDGDGRLDVFLARCALDPDAGPSLLLRQQGDGERFPTFAVDPVVQAAFADTCAHGASFGDYDRDGAVDLFVALTGSDRLYHNNGDGTFTDVSVEAGVAGPADDINTSGYWVDVTHDGLLDLFVPSHTAVFPPGPSPRNANRLYIGRGDGSFVEVGAEAGVAGDGSTQAAAITDLDGDGELELYLANDRFAVDGRERDVALDPDRWFDLESIDDEGIPRYVDRGGEYGVDGPRSSMGVGVADVNGDGHDDIYVADLGTNHLQIWDPDRGRYDDRAADWGLDLRQSPLLGLWVAWDVAFTDLDRDGALELMVVHGSIEPPRSCDDFAQLDVIMRADGDTGGFFDITAEVGLPATPSCPPQDDRPLAGRGLLLADIDGDDDDDVIITPHVERYRFYRNDTDSAGQRFLRVMVQGTVSAPLPYGAVLELDTDDGRRVRRNLYAGGTHTQRQPRFDIGLGDDAELAAATLSWPSGYVQRLDLHPSFTLGSTWVVTEPEWLAVSARVAATGDPAPVLTYRPVDETGAFVGADAAGREVQVVRSDGVAATVTDNGDGSYQAPLPHPGAARTTVVRVIDGGQTLRPRLTIMYR